MKKLLVCLVVFGGLMMMSWEAGAYTSHNWRAWATTAGYVDGKFGAPVEYGPDMGYGCGCGGGIANVGGCIGGLVQTVLTIPCMLLSGVTGSLNCMLCGPAPCGPPQSCAPCNAW